MACVTALRGIIEEKKGFGALSLQDRFVAANVVFEAVLDSPAVREVVDGAIESHRDAERDHKEAVKEMKEQQAKKKAEADPKDKAKSEGNGEKAPPKPEPCATGCGFTGSQAVQGVEGLFCSMCVKKVCPVIPKEKKIAKVGPFVPGLPAARIRARGLGCDRNGATYLRMTAGDVVVQQPPSTEATDTATDTCKRRKWLRIKGGDRVSRVAERCIPDSANEGPLRSSLLLVAEGVKDDRESTLAFIAEQKEEADEAAEEAAEEEPHSCYACACVDQSNSLLLCDNCDAAYHTFCLRPPLQDVPRGQWFCDTCAYDRRCKRQEAAMEAKLRRELLQIADTDPGAAGGRSLRSCRKPSMKEDSTTSDDFDEDESESDSE